MSGFGAFHPFTRVPSKVASPKPIADAQSRRLGTVVMPRSQHHPSSFRQVAPEPQHRLCQTVRTIFRKEKPGVVDLDHLLGARDRVAQPIGPFLVEKKVLKAPNVDLRNSAAAVV